MFVITNDELDRKTAKVVLPASLDAALRETSSNQSWLTEKMAKADCAFEAYIKLYEAGLVNDHLVPVTISDDALEIETRDSFAMVQRRLDVWADAAKLWALPSRCFVVDIQFDGVDHISPLKMFLPLELKSKITVPLYWNKFKTLTATLTPDFSLSRDSGNKISPAVLLQTDALLRSLFSLRLPVILGREPSIVHPYLVVPSDYCCVSSALSGSHSVLSDKHEPGNIHEIDSMQVDDFQQFGEDLLRTGLLRAKDRPFHVRPYECLSVLRKTPERVRLDEPDAPMEIDQVHSSGDTEIWLELRQIPKRLDFLHEFESKDAHTAVEILPATDFSFDPFPLARTKSMLFFPSICHRIELRLTAERLQSSLLSGIGISNVELVETAISAPSAREATSYDRLEYLGDTLLKVHASFQLYAEHPLWPEGQLTVAKTYLVNNAHLSKAAVRIGLDQYIHTEPFHGAHWRPAMSEELLRKDVMQTRQLSTKVLADIVEAIIGAAYMDGIDAESRDEKTLASLCTLLPEVKWQLLPELVPKMIPTSKNVDLSFSNLLPLQDLLGYRFKYPLLLVSAFTHPSVVATSAISSTYQQLEFLGDALLDKIVVETMMLYRPERPLRQSTMTLIRHALVNTHILGFYCLQSSYEDMTQQPAYDPALDRMQIFTKSSRRHLWQFMRHDGNPGMITAQTTTMSRYALLSPTITEALAKGLSYPWIPLLQLYPDKFCSDIIESTLAAMFIDSGADLEVCRTWLRSLGLLEFLERVLDEDIDCFHPKQKVGILAGTRTVKYLVESALTADAKLDRSSAKNLDEEHIEGEKFSTMVDSAAHFTNLGSVSSDTSLSSSGSESHELRGPFACTILIDGKKYGTALGGRSRDEVEARAAAIAVDRLKTEGRIINETPFVNTNETADIKTSTVDVPVSLQDQGAEHSDAEDGRVLLMNPS